MAVTKNDFNPEDYVNRVSELEKFKEDFSGKNFDKKICEAIKDSRDVEGEIKKIVWATVKNKIIWIILGYIALIATNFILRAIPTILSVIFK